MVTTVVLSNDMVRLLKTVPMQKHPEQNKNQITSIPFRVSQVWRSSFWGSFNDIGC